MNFNPQGSREPRPNLVCPAVSRPYISIHKALASLDPRYPQVPHPSGISIHKALASLDRGHGAGHGRETVFQSTRLSRASTYWWWGEERPYYISIHKALASLDYTTMGKTDKQIQFQSTRLSRASTSSGLSAVGYLVISIHKALASLDLMQPKIQRRRLNFNPQGSREPRQC